MHELGVVFYIIDAVEEAAKENNVSHVYSVTVEIGEVSGVIPEYLIDVWNWTVKSRELLTDCVLKVERISAVTYCKDCQKTYPTIRYGRVCPYCSGERTSLQHGKEFNVKEIEV